MNSALSSPKKELKNCSFNFIFSMFLCMYLSYMIRNRSQKFWDIYQGYLLTFEQGARCDATYLILFINVWTIKGLLDDANEIWFQNQCDKILGLQDMF